MLDRKGTTAWYSKMRARVPSLNTGAWRLLDEQKQGVGRKIVCNYLNTSNRVNICSAPS
jgi:hypothetical protein